MVHPFFNVHPLNISSKFYVLITILLLLGGPIGFSDVVWKVNKYKKDGYAPSIVFAYDSYDGEEGDCTFSLLPNSNLLIYQWLKHSSDVEVVYIMDRISWCTQSNSDLHPLPRQQADRENEGQSSKQGHTSQPRPTHLLEPWQPQQWRHLIRTSPDFRFPLHSSEQPTHSHRQIRRRQRNPLRFPQTSHGGKPNQQT